MPNRLPNELDIVNFDYNNFPKWKDFPSELIEIFQMDEKNTSEYKRLINQWEENDTFYIFVESSKFKLIKDGKETEISLDKNTIIWETTLLQYLNWKKTSATASIDIKWKYYQISFEKFKKKFQTLSKEEQNKIISKLKEIESKRIWKTKPILE